MLEAFEELLVEYGWQIALIALVGIVLLEILKYFKVFEKIEKEEYRHLLYVGCSAVFSIIATIIYLVCVGLFDGDYVVACALSMFGINQVAYATLDGLSLIELIELGIQALVDVIKNALHKGGDDDLEEEEVDDEEPEEDLDPEEDDLSDERIIIRCRHCGSDIYMNPNEVQVDDDGLANVGEACPICGETDGFEVIGVFIDE